jgi:DNA-binding transcriptional ArsR family regulator
MANYSSDLDRTFHALSDPTRRAIVVRLSIGPASVSELQQPFEVAMPTLLQHLRVLEEGGLIATAKSGRVRRCTIRPAGLDAAAAWLERQRTTWENRLDRMEAYLTKHHARETKHGKRKR